MNHDLAPATLAGVPLHTHLHACAFVRGRDEERSFIAPFLSEAIACGEKALYIVDDAIREEHRRKLVEAGVRGREGQVEIATWLETYLVDGRFDAAKMLDRVDEVMRAGRAQGFPRMRIVGQMGWAFAGPTDTRTLIEYEVRVNDVIAKHRNPAVCVYDVERLSGTVMMDLLRAHPLAIVGGVLYENPFFTPPETMLVEIARRGSHPAVA